MITKEGQIKTVRAAGIPILFAVGTLGKFKCLILLYHDKISATGS